MRNVGWIAVGGVAAALMATVGCTTAGSPDRDRGAAATARGGEALATAEINPVVTDCNITLPPVAPATVTPAIARSGLPCAVQFKDRTVNLDTLQQAFDFNAWLTFVALTAPAMGRADGPAAWEGWQDLSSLMLAGGAPPPPFGTSITAPSICAGGTTGAPVLRMISKTPTTPTVSVAGQPLNTGPLIDQNGNYTRYQILVNRPMYDYVVANRLYSRAGQRGFAGTVQFPVGADAANPPNGRGTIGAIVVKVAWKVLAGSDDPSTFHTVTGYVYSPASGSSPATCRTQTLGLVGLHIVHKTANEPQWNWATFEHLGNVPDGPTTTGSFHYYDPACGAAACPVNRQPPQPWDPAVQPFPNGFHSQIVRTTSYRGPAQRSADRWNPQFQGALRGSVLANYELVTTQWPTLPKGSDPNGAPFPLFAANSTMETYVQGNVPQASSSCMACHGNATDVTGKPSDFSFVLEKAQ